MWIYYLLIIISVAMFGGGFALNDVYRRMRGSGLIISMESSCIGSIAGLVLLLLINGFVFEFTPFTLLMAALASLNGIAFTFCAFRALDYINLSLFSVFAMLGGMALPFLQGMIFYGEPLTVAKGVCVVFIALALILTVQRGEKKNGSIFYAGIFLLNGMSGVISKIFTSSTLPKASPAGYSILCSLVTILLSSIVWIILAQRKKQRSKEALHMDLRRIYGSYGVSAANGAINKIANYMLVVALAHVEASVQYPMVTGGTMIVSTVISLFGDKKPDKNEIISVALAFIGMLALFLIPV